MTDITPTVTATAATGYAGFTVGRRSQTAAEVTPAHPTNVPAIPTSAARRPRHRLRPGTARTPARHTAPQRPPAALDFGEVPFCDAAGLAVLIGIQHRATGLGSTPRLADPRPQITKLLRITGLDRSPIVHTPCATRSPRPRPWPR